MISKSTLIFLFCLCSFSAHALTVVTTLPELAEIVRALAPEASVESLLAGGEDPHFVDARPSYILKTSKAKLVIGAGFDLESGWLPKVLSKSAVASLQPGGPGYCEAGDGVSALEKATGPIDRSMGDVHAAGNPHYYLSPPHLIQAARAIKNCLIRVDPTGAEKYETGLKIFTTRMENLRLELENELRPVVTSPEKNRFFEYHRELTYFADSFGLKILGTVEEKPGLPPSAARLSSITKDMRNHKIRLVLASTLHPESNLRKLRELSGIPYRQVDVMASKSRGIEETLRALAAAIVEGTTP